METHTQNMHINKKWADDYKKSWPSWLAPELHFGPSHIMCNVQTYIWIETFTWVKVSSFGGEFLTHRATKESLFYAPCFLPQKFFSNWISVCLSKNSFTVVSAFQPLCIYYSPPGKEHIGSHLRSRGVSLFCARRCEWQACLINLFPDFRWRVFIISAETIYA